MRLRIDPDRDIKTGTCDCCRTPFERVTGFVNNDDGAYAIYYASCYHHDGIHEAWIDVIIDDAWVPDDPVSRPGANRVTFGCRVGPVENSPVPACSLVTGAAVAPDEPFYGRKLTRDEALAHPWLSDYWETIDHILENDLTVRQHLYGVTTSEQASGGDTPTPG
ncbi:hypothetical protein FH608_035255 [Nonomuraea phyllanthi]|uniref:Uncharacterized protein n=1 Tax=Nonomuraea phyllanthi TaxID=2219224 RepID=A0A5C4VWU3_9ACTN|nr:hypothetical protein [Nonomuraea phyllanthi]KAB8190238.1 hypothetical protein FH608_035255 [Nonomuraea phyllanthi]